MSTLSTAVTMALFGVAARSTVAGGPGQSEGPSALGVAQSGGKPEVVERIATADDARTGDTTTPAGPPRKGLTWARGEHNSQLGTDYVSCGGEPHPEGRRFCDFYFGDTPCTTRLPILCLRVDGSRRPNYDHPGISVMQEWSDGWADGRIALSEPVLGTQLDGLSAANAICEQSLGAGYRMAEFHDGKYVVGMTEKGIHGDAWPPPEQLKPGLWGFHAFGDVPPGTRFWAHINSQPANCWDRPVDPATTGTLLEARELAVMQACLRKAKMVKRDRCVAIIDKTLSEGELGRVNNLATAQLTRQLQMKWPEYCSSGTPDPTLGQLDSITRVAFRDEGSAGMYMGPSFVTGCEATPTGRGRWNARLWFNEP